MKHGFIKVAAATPRIRVADCGFNAAEVILQIREADAKGVRILVLPELCVTGYTCGDLFFQKKLLSSALGALKEILEASSGISTLVFIGLPLSFGGGLYNCAAVLFSGKLLGIIPKSNLPNYGEFSEGRWFIPAPPKNTMVTLLGQTVPFGANILFRCSTIPELCVAAEICEDIWTPCPPSVGHTLAGATIIVNLSASNEAVGKARYRRLLASSLSTRLNCGYIYASAGEGESTTDVVFSGHNIIAESGVILAESKLFVNGFASTEIDVGRLDSERRRFNTYVPSGGDGYTTVMFDALHRDTMLTRKIDPHPFVPKDETELAERCETVLSIQTGGLKKRLQHVGSKRAVVATSGGLDSTLALLVALRAMKSLCHNASDVLAVSLPCFGTSNRTRENARKLSNSLGVSFREIDITASVNRHLSDIGHGGVEHDAAYENAQARERMQVVMDIANMEGGLVVGTGDLSELALGWTTFGGDHMSMYGVNASVPKTLIAHIIRYEANRLGGENLVAVTNDICNTPISPELLPPDSNGITQKTEDIIGPYELVDFFLYNAIRWTFSPSKVLRLAELAFTEKYNHTELLKHLKSFYRKFFAGQFKRSCIPDGPRVGSVALSPRGDWHMPSDACVNEWINELNAIQ